MTVVKWANVPLRPLDLQLQHRPQWDRQFERWARQGADVVDPNDVGDTDWASDLLAEGSSSTTCPCSRPMP